MMTPVLVFVLLAMSVLCLGLALFRGGMPEPADEPVSLKPPRLTAAFASLLPASQRAQERIRAELIQAGFYRRHAFETFSATRNAAVLMWVLFAFVLLVLSARSSNAEVLRVVMGGLIGLVLIYSLPGVIVSALAAARKKRIYQSLPDALDMLTMMMTGGLGLNRSLDRACRQLQSAHPDLAKELSIVHRHADVGSFGKSMQRFAERMDDPEITGLSTLIQHSEKLGSPIGEALIEYSDGIRRTRRQRAEEIGNKRNVMLLFPVILFLAPPVYILLLGPATLELRDFLNRDARDPAVVGRSLDSLESGRLTSDQTGASSAPEALSAAQ